MDGDVFEDAAQRWADQQRRYAKLVARYWADERFQEAMRRDPAAVLRQAGIEIPNAQRLRVVEVAEDERVLLIPRVTRSFEAQEPDYFTFGTRGTLGTVFTLDGCLGTLACALTFGCSHLTVKWPEDSEAEGHGPDGHPPAPDSKDTGARSG